MRTLRIQKELLGTPIVLDVVAENEGTEEAERAMSRAFEECERIQNAYSRFTDGNELSDLNSQVGKWTSVGEELYQLICFAERVREKTDGAFDLSVKTILEGWGYDKNYSLQESVPGYTGKVEVGEKQEVRLSAPIELGGLGKGYAIDRMMDHLKVFANVHLNAGGDIFVRGRSTEGKPWRLVFEHPTEIGKGIGFVDSTNLALACSSPSRRNWGRGDLASPKRHHLVDPRTSKPANKMLAVYTQSQSALLADSYSTALFVLGYEAAKKLLEEGRLHGLIEAMLISPEGKVWRSSGFQGELFT